MVDMYSSAGFPVRFVILGTGIIPKKKRVARNRLARFRSVPARGSTNPPWLREGNSVASSNTQTTVSSEPAFNSHHMSEQDRRQTYTINKNAVPAHPCPNCGTVFSDITHSTNNTYKIGLAPSVALEKQEVQEGIALRRDTFTKSAASGDALDMPVCSSITCRKSQGLCSRIRYRSSLSDTGAVCHQLLPQHDKYKIKPLLLPEEVENFDDSLEVSPPMDGSQKVTGNATDDAAQSIPWFGTSSSFQTLTPFPGLLSTKKPQFEAFFDFTQYVHTEAPVNLGTWCKGPKPPGDPEACSKTSIKEHHTSTSGDAVVKVRRSLTFPGYPSNMEGSELDNVLGIQDSVPFLPEGEDSVTEVQDYWKEYEALKALALMQKPSREQVLAEEAAVLVQAAVRGWLIRKRFQAQRNAAIKIQRRVRASLAAKHERIKFLEMRQASVKIQAFYRMVCARRVFLATKAAAVLVQHRWRANRIFRKDLHNFQMIKSVTTKLQAYARGLLLRKNLAEKQRAAIVIQSHWRRYVVCRTFRLHEVNAIKIQLWWRMTKQKESYQKTKAAVITIQKHYRRHVARQNFLQQKKAVCTIENFWLAIVEVRKAREAFLSKKHAAIKIQAFWRASKERRSYVKQKYSAVSIQKHYRGYVSRRNFLKQKRAVSIIEKFWLCTMEARKAREAFLNIKQAAIKIQAAWRGWKERKHYLKRKRSVILIQKYYRGYVAKYNYLKQKHAVCTIEKFWLGTTEARKVREAFVLKKQAAVKIQTTWRAWKERKCYLEQKRSAILIQKRFRAFIARRRKKAVRTIENFWLSVQRTRKARNDFLLKKQAAITIQAYWKMCAQRRRYLCMKQSAVTIQCRFRGFIAIRDYCVRKECAIIIQHFWLSRRQARRGRQEFLLLRRAAITIQAYWKMCKERKQYLQLKSSTIFIQAQFRGFIARREYIRQRKAVMTIEAFWIRVTETRCARENFLSMKKAAVIIQSSWRMFTARKHYLEVKKSIVTIQVQYRRFMARKEYTRQKNAIITIEKFWIRAKEARKAHQQFTLLKKATQTIQTFWRMARERRRYLQMKAERLAEIQRQHAAATVIQAAWRASRERRQAPEDPLLDIRRRLSMASALATREQQVCNRTRNSLERLTRYKFISSIVLELNTLAATSTLLPSCCLQIASKENVSILCDVISRTNRSITDADIVTKALAILLNLAKFQDTLEVVWNDGRIYPLILKLLQAYANSNGVLFRKALLLLWFLCRNKRWTDVMKQTPGTGHILKSISMALRRRQLMEERKRSRKQTCSTASTSCSAIQHAAVENLLPNWKTQVKLISETEMMRDVLMALDITNN